MAFIDLSEFCLTRDPDPVRRAGLRKAWRCIGAVLDVSWASSRKLSVVTATSEASDRRDSSSS